MKRSDMRAEYRVEGIPPSILAKITEFQKAVDEYAFIGTKHPEDHEAIEEQLCVARYNLERTIKTQLIKAGRAKR